MGAYGYHEHNTLTMTELSRNRIKDKPKNVAIKNAIIDICLNCDKPICRSSTCKRFRMNRHEVISTSK